MQYPIISPEDNSMSDSLLNSEKMRNLELLAPAKDALIAREAILHGADAVYMGAASHGARKSAGNSLDDIRRTIDFAHQFRAKVYVTVNTIVYENELRSVERLITDLYRCGTDAIIVQDMGILRLDIPPIALHASTQCDNRTPEKVRFLENVGFSQAVLARELTLREIHNIADKVSIPLEVFVHGALCVSYSGRCHASQAACGRSANRGECAQLCRLPYTLRDANGKILAKDKHLLSLKDFNLSDRLAELAEAGASSFKIEGRLKDAAYVKNVTAFYRNRLDALIANHPEKYKRASCGRSQLSFEPDPFKSFNRGFTHYFIDGRKPDSSLYNPLSPKSMGEPIHDLSKLNNGDGISWFGKNGEFRGTLVNDVINGTVVGSNGKRVPADVLLHRTSDLRFQQQLSKPSAIRKIGVNISIDNNGISATDERGMSVRIPLGYSVEKARTPQDHRLLLSKLGDTIYRLDSFTSSLTENDFIPASRLSGLKRELTEALDRANEACYGFDYRHIEKKESSFPDNRLDFRDNIANSKARDFYKTHGVKTIESALECSKDRKHYTGKTVMTTRHCILRELGNCLTGKCKNASSPQHSHTPAMPLTLSDGTNNYILRFNCVECEMQLITNG